MTVTTNAPSAAPTRVPPTGRSWRRIGLRVAGRLVAATVVVWAVVTFTFFAVRAVPGDPVTAILGGPGSNASEEAIAQARADFGLDLPLGQQYLNYLGQLLRGDLGESYRLHRDVADIVGQLVPGTLALASLALVLGWVFALGLAWWSVRGGRGSALAADFIGIVASALPHFWLGALLISFLATGLGLPVAISGPGFGGLIVPALTLALPLGGYLAQVMRDALVATLEEPYVLAARARGETRAGVFLRHLLRRAAVPAIGLTGWAFGSLVSGAVVVEQLFARPGLGRALVDAVLARDVPMVQGVLIVVAVAYVVVTLVTDVLERAVMPPAKEARA
ncbi:ABC transporter permease [Gulosibacter sp. ACHW.36C]|uniref:ABC transporter permease n=1 Tax=Gulosibacter sediminis TaxID=1729695 RepID=A0ABY4MXU9_9MICO|nr:ABC transporter permease [Gulosibacter sediminis]UQN14216.1 ABC transporter permease [Gulosibacter sediminis]